MTEGKKRCVKCGKIFPPFAENTMCARCTIRYREDIERVHEAMYLHNKRTVDEIASYAALSHDEVRRIMGEPALQEMREEAQLLPSCVRCKDRPAQKGSQFCLACRLELNKAFGDAARTIARQIEHEMTDRRAQAKGIPNSLLDEVDKKRKRSKAGKFYTDIKKRYSR
ncbi:MAG: hypothetical protein K1Y02_01455 [Candidatus Hydrogenedentes bacterium]|nr:hypothetical protein [Candidatus Hydrogenedentota bacterium]